MQHRLSCNSMKSVRISLELVLKRKTTGLDEIITLFYNSF